jgi:hypothetical protein
LLHLQRGKNSTADAQGAKSSQISHAIDLGYDKKTYTKDAKKKSLT